METRFDAATHTYYRGNVVLPSVTTVLDRTWPRDDGAPDDAIEGARQRGEWVDQAFTSYLMTDEAEIPEGTPQAWADCLGFAVDWWNKERLGARVQCQLRLFGEMEAGSLDLLVEGHSVIDLKATYYIAKTVPAQLGGYAMLLHESCGTYTDHIAALHVHPRFKKAQFREYDWAEGCRQWRVLRDYDRLVNR